MNREIFKLAIPNIISNLTVPLVGIVDVALMGHLKNPAYLGAIAISASIFTFIYAGLGFIRMGTSGFTAQSYGERNIEKSFLILARAIFIALSCAVLLILAQDGIAWLAFHFIDSSQDVQIFAKQYFATRIWAAPASLSLFAIMGWYIGMQDAKTPMFLSIIINITNILLSVFFVLHEDMNVSGVALGTVIGQYLGLFVGIILLSRKTKQIKKYWHRKMIFVWSEIGRFMNVNKDILIRSLLLTGSFYYFNAASANLGDEVLAVNSILLQFLWIFSYFIDGFAFAAEALTGKYIGAGLKENLKKLVKLLLIWGGALSLVVALVYLAFNQQITQLLTKQQEVILLTKDYSFWVILIPIVSFSAFVWDGVYIGATKGKMMRNTMIAASLFVFIPGILIFRHFWGNNGMWLALLIFMLFRGVSLHFFFRKKILDEV